MPYNNIEMLQIIADGLEELKEEVVFVGGAVAELYADDPASSDIRPTLDIDCVIKLNSRLEYAKLNQPSSKTCIFYQSIFGDFAGYIYGYGIIANYYE